MKVWESKKGKIRQTFGKNRGYLLVLEGTNLELARNFRDKMGMFTSISMNMFSQFSIDIIDNFHSFL